jgi:toxin ParE1/3/4
MKPTRLIREVLKDIRFAANRYERERPGLGERFLSALARALKLISENPDCGVRFDQSMQLKRVRRFPYRVVFLNQPLEVVVIAVHHDSKDHTYWDDRIAGELNDPPSHA